MIDLKLTAVSSLAGLLIFGCVEGYRKSKKAYAKHKIEEEERRKLAKMEHDHIVAEFDKVTNMFKKKYPFSKIIEASLNNSNLKAEQKSFIFDTLSSKYYKIAPAVPQEPEFIDKSSLKHLMSRVTWFDNAYSILTNKENDVVQGYVKTLFDKKATEDRISAEYDAKQKEKEKVENELRKINAKKDAELSVLNAKLKLEDSKFKTLMKTMESAGSKNSSINLKANVDLSGDDN